MLVGVAESRGSGTSIQRSRIHCFLFVIPAQRNIAMPLRNNWMSERSKWILDINLTWNFVSFMFCGLSLYILFVRKCLCVAERPTTDKKCLINLYAYFLGSRLCGLIVHLTFTILIWADVIWKKIFCDFCMCYESNGLTLRAF